MSNEYENIGTHRRENSKRRGERGHYASPNQSACSNDKMLQTYGSYLRGLDLTDEQKIELIGLAKWSVESVLTKKYLI